MRRPPRSGPRWSRLRSDQEQVSAVRPELAFEDVPAPRTLAPFATAFGAHRRRVAAATEVAWGSFVLLYDPAGQHGWAGPLRIIAYVRADLEPEIAADPLIGQVGWSWLTEALDARGRRLRGAQRHRDPGGHRGLRRQAGRAADDRLRAAGLLVAGAVADLSEAGPGRPPRPSQRGGLDGHLAAWCDALCAAAGLPPLVAGVTALRPPGPAARHEQTPYRPDPGPRQQAATQEQAAGQQQHPEAVPLLEPRDGLPPLITTAADAGARRRTRSGAGEGRSRWTPSGPPASATGTGPSWSSCAAGRGHGADRPGRLPRPVRRRRGAGRHRGRAARGLPGPALPGRARLPAAPSCSTPSWPGGCSATRGSGSARWSRRCSGFTLEKSHSAADWSTRPLPAEWLRYAALDVEVLVELRDALAASWPSRARPSGPGRSSPPCSRPGRRPRGPTRGAARPASTACARRRGLAVVRELWLERDKIARQRDLSPGRVLPDSAIVEAARALPGPRRDLTELPGFKGRGARRHAADWRRAVARARAQADPNLPGTASRPPEGPPPAHRWAERDPVAAQRLAAVRAAVAAIADEHSLPGGEPPAPGRRAQAGLAAAGAAQPARRSAPICRTTVPGPGRRS